MFHKNFYWFSSLNNDLANHKHSISDVSNLQSNLTTYEARIQKNVNDISALNNDLANTQTALDNKVTTGTSAKLNTLALAGSKIALVYSEDDNVNFRYKNASGNTSYLNLRNIESKFDTLTSTLTSRGGYTCLAGLYSSTDEATTSIACSTISNYSWFSCLGWVFICIYCG